MKQQFTVERAYLVPVYQHVTVEAEDAAEACRIALDHDDWDSQIADYESARATYIDGVWQGATAYGESGLLASLPVPADLQSKELRTDEPPPAVCSLIQLAREAPAADPGEGYWDDMETAHNLGIRQGTYSAAALIRPALAALGFEAPEGVAICTCCGRDEGDGHDPDCDCEDEGADVEESPLAFATPAPADVDAGINEALGGPIATPERIAATEDAQRITHPYGGRPDGAPRDAEECE